MQVINQEIINKIDKYIEENKQNILEDLMALVRVPSVRGEATSDSPFGVGPKQMLKATAAMFEREGFESMIEKDNYYTISYYGDSDKTIGVFSHGDVVAVDDDWLICPPFEPIIKDGYMFGRGCNDDKSGIVEALYAAKMIRDLQLPFNSRIVMFTGANEESGMEDIQKFAENEPMPDLCLVPDGDYPYYAGERSILRYNVTCKKPFETIKAFYGGESENIVLGKATAEIPYSAALFSEIENICKNNKDITCKCQDDTVIITAKGLSTHTGAVAKSINAAKLLAEALLSCENLPETDKTILKDVCDFICDGYGKGFGIEHIDSNFGKLICANGIARTKDGKLILHFDVRAGLEIELCDIEKIVSNACQERWEVEFTRRSRGHIVDNECAFSKAITKTVEYITGITDKKPLLISGGTYARYLKNAYPIGTINHALEEPIELPKGHGNYHGPDEKLGVEGFLNAMKILTCLLLEEDAVLHKDA